MVHYTDIDLTKGKPVCSSYLIGREKENATEAIRLIVPPKYALCKFVFDFRLEDGSSYSSAKIDYSDTGTIEFTLPQHVLRKGALVIGIRAIDSATGFVKRVFERSFVCSENITSSGEEVSSEEIQRLVNKVDYLYDKIDCSLLERLAISEDGDLLFDGKIVVTKEDVPTVDFILEDGNLMIAVESAYAAIDADGYLRVLVDGIHARMNEQNELEVLI